MATKTFAKGLKRSALTVALGMCFAGGVYAQSTSGTIFGNVGEGAGATVVARNVDTGASITVTPDANGRYSLNALPIGRYTVTLQRNGSAVSTRENVQVLVGRGTEVEFGDAAGAAGSQGAIDTVTVVGGALHQIDVSQIESRTVITKAELDKLPLAQNLSQIALIAPGVVQGDSRYAGPNGAALPSFAGSSQSENAYYINGYPVLNPLTNVGFTQLPFNSISQVQLSTSGYGVEYGRATGGVVNVITASGTNDWKAGGQFIWRPEGTQSDARNIFYGPNGRPSTAFGGAGRIAQYRQDNNFDRKTLSAYVGGPIVKDRLFFYAAGELVRTDAENSRLFATSANTVNTTLLNTGWSKNEADTPRWLGKIDWLINDDHRIELTAFQDRTKVDDAYYGLDYRNESYAIGGVRNGGQVTDDNNRIAVANYTGYFTDDITVTAMYGRSKFEHLNQPFAYNPACPRVNVTAVPAAVNPVNCQNAAAALLIPGANDRTKAYRFNFEWRLGDHALNVGYDYQDVISLTGTTLPGDATFNYLQQTPATTPIDPAQGVRSPASNGGFGTQGYYVQKLVVLGRSNIEVEQKAQYIKDVWQVTPNFLIEVGVRNEQFANFNSAGQAFAKKDRQIAPRLGATWDVFGDSTFKLFANAGRYHLAMPPNVAFRGADGIINTQEYFTYTGVDAQGRPTGTTPLGPGPVSANNEFGQPKDFRTIAKEDLGSHFQDAFAVGMEKNLGSFNVGAKLSYATLKSAIDDFCDYRPFVAWGNRNGFSAADATYFSQNFGCALFNPGEGGTFLQDYNGDGRLERISLSAQDLGYPELKRTYTALDLFFEHPFDGKWYLRADYSLSKSRGNAEGQLLSDLGQQDVSQTQSFDFPELLINNYGYLPNDRRHQVKFLGYYQIAPEWTVSGNMQYATGRPGNCLAFYDGADAGTNPANNYGSSFFTCNGRTVPRGTFLTLPETFRLDLGLRYQPLWAKGLSLSVDVFNVTNRQVTQNYEERQFQGGPTTVRQDWLRTISYSTPRSAQFTVRYDWNGGDN